ncbi:hypothetical protein H1164_15865 [Thermoactinomyces daqus]|uniref:Uncharacterized protein n=1 Tax=Thermoactinomyces daqus TaxID=1329516 RepID=A0A7W1XD29_9BACL|nr:hypothetical protein [Thermoactinomyces daqus]
MFTKLAKEEIIRSISGAKGGFELAKVRNPSLFGMSLLQSKDQNPFSSAEISPASVFCVGKMGFLPA